MHKAIATSISFLPLLVSCSRPAMNTSNEQLQQLWWQQQLYQGQLEQQQKQTEDQLRQLQRWQVQQQREVQRLLQQQQQLQRQQLQLQLPR